MLSPDEVEHHLFQAGEDLRHRLNLIWDCIKLDPMMWDHYEVRIAWHAMSMSKDYFDAHLHLLEVLDDLPNLGDRADSPEVADWIKEVEKRRLGVQKVLMRPPGKPKRKRRGGR